MKRFLLLLGALTLTGSGSAQTLVPAGQTQNATAPGQAKKVDPIATERAAVNNAIALATTTDLTKTPNLNAVENALTAVNQSKQNSAAWQLETAQRLLHVAEQIARAGKPANVSALANRALQDIAVADSPSQDATTRASAKTLTAWIYERYLADPTSAQSSYKAAAQLAPSNSQAQEGAGRLQSTHDNVSLKPTHGG